MQGGAEFCWRKARGAEILGLAKGGTRLYGCSKGGRKIDDHMSQQGAPPYNK